MNKISLYSFERVLFNVNTIKLVLHYHFKETNSNRTDFITLTLNKDNLKWYDENGKEFDFYNYQDFYISFFEVTKKNTINITVFKEV